MRLVRGMITAVFWGVGASLAHPAPVFAADLARDCREFGAEIARQGVRSYGGPQLSALLRDFQSWPEAEAERRQDEVIDLMIRTPNPFSSYTPFIFFNEPGRVFSKAVFYRALHDLAIWGGRVIPRRQLLAEIRNRLNAYLAQPPPDPSGIPDPFVNAQSHRRDEETMRLASVAAPYFCHRSGVAGCASGVRKLISEANRVLLRDASFIYVDHARRYLTDPKFYRGTLLSAKKLLSRVSRVEAGAAILTKLDGDILDSFLESGLAPADAHEAAWLALMFYGLRGATYGDLLISRSLPEVYDPMLYAHSVISLAIGYLDKYTYAAGSYYSLPSGITSDCVYGKSYRVWLAGFQVELLKRETEGRIRDAAAAVSSQALGMIYSAYSATNGRQSLHATYDQVESPINSAHRMDLLFSSLGSLIPTRALENPVNAGDAYTRMVESARPVELNGEPTLGDWKRVIAPFGMFEAYDFR